MQCFASATASSFSGAMVARVERDIIGRSDYGHKSPYTNSTTATSARCHTHDIGKFLWSFGPLKWSAPVCTETYQGLSTADYPTR